MNNETANIGAERRASGDTIDLMPRVDAHLPVASTPDANAAPPDLCGRVLAHRYALISLLGSGGMGHIFKALDWQRRDLAESDRHVAVKVLRRDGVDGARLAADLRREFYCAQTLAHPNIVKVYETSQDGDAAFFTMEMLQGETLSALLNRSRPAPVQRERAWTIIRDIGMGLAHAHSRCVVHGDLKPANIMVTREREIRILDFGASGSLRRGPPPATDVLQRDTVPAVTPAYTCCELLAGQLADPRDDLYALACISYELLSGGHPFQGRSAFAARQQGMVPQRPPGLSSRQWRALRQGLAWQREDRSITVDDWLAQLGLMLSANRLPGSQSLSRLVPRWPKQWRSPPRHVRHAALGGGLLASVCALLVYNLASPNLSAASSGRVPEAVRRDALEGQVAARVLPVRTGAAAVNESPPAKPRRLQRPVRVWAENFRVLPGQRFAQVTVMRSSAVGETKFTWWTEAASAMPGRDFVEQRPASQAFSNGRRSTSVFVRLLPNQLRKNSESFYVAIGSPVGGAAMHAVARAAIWIPVEEAAMVAAN